MCPRSCVGFVSAVMPLRSYTPSPASGNLRRLLPSLIKRSWWAMDGEGRRQSSMNKLVVPVPVLKGFPRCNFYAGGYHGGTDGMELHWSSWIWRFGRRSFSSTKSTELRRPLLSSGSDGRWAASLDLPATLLVEGRPHGAAAQAGARSFSSSRRDALREAVLHRHRFRSHLLWRRLKAMEWRVVDVKWFVPDVSRRGPVLRWQSGPDCDLSSCSGVLFAKSVDWSVISFLVCPLLRIVPSLRI